MDNHFWPDFCIFYDTCDCAKYVSDCRAFTQAYEAHVWRQMDQLPRHSAIHITADSINDHYITGTPGTAAEKKEKLR